MAETGISRRWLRFVGDPPSDNADRFRDPASTRARRRRLPASTPGRRANPKPVLFTTLGFTAKLALAPLRTQPGYRDVHVFYHADKAESEAALGQVRTACDTLGVKLTVHKVSDPFDYTAFLVEFGKVLRAVGDAEVHVNASGGTRVGIMAATIFCFTRDLPLLYFDEYGAQEGKRIPLRALRNLDRLSKTPLAILRRLQTKGPADMGTLQSELGGAASTLTEHVQTLLEAGTVTVQRAGKRRIVTLLPDLGRIDLEVMA